MLQKEFKDGIVGEGQILPEGYHYGTLVSLL